VNQKGESPCAQRINLTAPWNYSELFITFWGCVRFTFIASLYNRVFEHPVALVDHLMYMGAGIAQSVYQLGYGLDDRGIGVRFPARGRNSPPRRPDRLWDHPASYAMYAGG
jgi:hypothetical protein